MPVTPEGDFDEEGFQSWYKPLAKQHNLDPNPDHPLHFYDYRKAFTNNEQPDKTGHWPSKYKKLGHPNLIISGIDTRTGQKASPSLILSNMKEYQRITRSK